MRHPWVSASGRPWSLRVKSDFCRDCGHTPDTEDHQPPPLHEVAGDLLDQWDMKPGEKFKIEARYRNDAWWFDGRSGMIFVTPTDVVALLDIARRAAGRA